MISASTCYFGVTVSTSLIQKLRHDQKRMKKVFEDSDILRHDQKCKNMKHSQDMQLIQKLRDDQKRMKKVFEVMSGRNIVTNSRVTPSWREIVSLTFSEAGVLHVNWISFGHCVLRRAEMVYYTSDDYASESGSLENSYGEKPWFSCVTKHYLSLEVRVLKTGCVLKAFVLSEDFGEPKDFGENVAKYSFSYFCGALVVQNSLLRMITVLLGLAVVIDGVAINCFLQRSQ
ncbi:hypothetical protein Tco_1570473 [Tanacetum coccineum]